ncbi:MAG: hypothetical protein WBO10_03380 [Pyrinomonadaceae bacterium]
MADTRSDIISKVPAVTFGFWMIKIFATTLGEIGGNAFSMSLNWGYAISTAMFAVIFVISVIAQIGASRFRPALYWFAIIASTTVGTTTADMVTRDLGIGYSGGSLILLFLVLATLAIWRVSTGTVSVGSVSSPKTEIFYWLTITFSQTLGTALGDWFADTAGFGYLGSAIIFGIVLLAIYALHRFTELSRPAIFWAAFILTRPLGAVVGNVIDKPAASGGLEIGRFTASGILLAMIVVMIALFPHKAAVDDRVTQ